MPEATRRSHPGLVCVRPLAAVAAVVAALLLPAPLMAQQGGARVSVQLPELLVLRYRTDVQLQLAGSGQLAGASGGGLAESNGEGLVGLALHVDADLATAVASGTAQSDLTGALSGVFSVLGSSASGRMRVSASVEQATGRHADGATLQVTGATAIIGWQQGHSVTFDAPGVAASIAGGIGLEFDLTEARSPGWYQGVALCLVVEQT